MTIGIKVTTKKQILESQNRKCDSITTLKVVTIVIKITTKNERSKKDKIKIHITEKGQIRDSTIYYELNKNCSDKLIGIFNSFLIVIVENSYFNTNEKLLENKKVISLFSHNCSTINHSNIAIPVASFYEKSGTYVNKDGIKQKVISKIDKNNPKETITSIIEHLKSMIEKGTL